MCRHDGSHRMCENPGCTSRVAPFGSRFGVEKNRGLHGSRNYVKHVADTARRMEVLKDQPKISAYYNLDNGTGRIHQGVYLQGMKQSRRFSVNGSTFCRPRSPCPHHQQYRGTDHLSFDRWACGISIHQDEIEYDTRTHHANMDTYDHLIPEDLKQAATIVASFVFNTAMRDEKLPRKELAKPSSGGQRAFLIRLP